MCMQIRILKSKRFSAVPEDYEKNDLCAIRTIYISHIKTAHLVHSSIG